jgi:hypothetical protein
MTAVRNDLEMNKQEVVEKLLSLYEYRITHAAVISE